MLLGRNNQILSTLFSKVFERSVYWNEYRTKRDDKNRINKFRCFLKSKFVCFSLFI